MQTDHTDIVKEIEREESKKLRALEHMLRVVGQARGDNTSLQDYIEAAGNIDADAYVAACDDLRESWTNTFSAPQPGHIRDAARRYSAKSRSEIRYEQDHQRMQHARSQRMTKESIREDLAKCQGTPLPDDPFENRVESTRRASLTRILDGMEGKPIPKRTMRKRGEGGLEKPGFGFGEGVK